MTESGKWFPLYMSVLGVGERKGEEMKRENTASSHAEVQMAVSFTATQPPLPHEGEPTVTTLSLLPTGPYTEPSLVANFSPGCQFFLQAKRQSFALRTHQNMQTMQMRALLAPLSPHSLDSPSMVLPTAFHGMRFLVGSQTQPISRFEHRTWSHGGWSLDGLTMVRRQGRVIIFFFCNCSLDLSTVAAVL